MKTIKTITHLLLVDETAENPYKRYDWLLDELDKESPITQVEVESGMTCVFEYKIIAASPKLGDLPEFETLPPTEDYVEKLAMEVCPTTETEKYFIKGYKQAKSETGFSLENMKDFIKYQEEYNHNTIDDNVQTWLLKKSLTKPKEYEFVPEMIVDENDERNWYIDSPSGKYWEDEPVPPSKNNLYSNAKYLKPKIIKNKIQGTWKLVS